MGSHQREGSVERKRWIFSSEISCFPSALLLMLPLSLLPLGGEMGMLKGGRTAGEETHSSCYGQRERWKEKRRWENLPLLHHEDDEHEFVLLFHFQL